MKNKFLTIFMAIAFSSSFFIGCKKDKADDLNTLPEPSKESFIPQINHKYIYTITDQSGSTATATKWIDGGRDSSGIQLYNIHTRVDAAGQSITLNNKTYINGAFTYTRIDIPEAWYSLIALYKTLPDTQLQEAKILGFPGYSVIENNIREGATLNWEWPSTPGQYLKFLQKNSDGTFTTSEIEQKLIHNPTVASKVESVTVPGGTFVCNKYSYVITNQLTWKTNGVSSNSTGTEIINMWMAHGIGVVKTESQSELITVINTSSGPQTIKTQGRSTTTLKKIE